MCGIDVRYGRELNRDRNAHAGLDLADDVHVASLEVGAADRGIDRNRVDVELERRGARLLETAGVLNPSLGGRAVEAGDHGDVERLRRKVERLEMSGHPAVVVVELGKIRARLRLTVRAVLRVEGVGCVLRANLLLEERRSSPRRPHRRPRGVFMPSSVAVSGDAAATIGCASCRPR